MKRSLLFLLAAAAIAVACEKSNSPEAEPQDPNTVVYEGVTYKTVTLSNGQTWMAEPLRVLPEGKTASSDPDDGNGVWNPYKVVDGAAEVLTDEESIKELGYLYDYPTALGATLTEENYSTFEGARGICPEGWHLPTRAEFLAICGNSLKATNESAAIIDNTALFWDASASADGYATVVKANEAGFNFTFSGSTQKNTPEAAGKYPTTVITADKTEIEDFVGELAMTYLLGSTPYQWKAATATVSAYAQFFGMMTTFTSSFMKGKLSVAYTNERAGCSIRCIK
ncbi:MAG: FISUMP domain-containing protein, partial [Candidatus Cryptobacteroides sp.]